MRLLKLAFSMAPGAILWTALLNVLCGLATIALMASLRYLLNGHFADRGSLYGFALLLLLLCCKNGLALLSRRTIVAVVRRVGADIRLRMCQQIVTTPLATLERIGSGRITAALTDEFGSVVSALAGFADLFSNTAVLFACVGYLALLSPTLLAISIASFGVGSLLLFTAQISLFPLLHKSVRARAVLYGQFHELLLGAKELRLNEVRRRAFWGRHLTPALHQLHDLVGDISNRHAVSSMLIEGMHWLMVGTTFFVAPRFTSVTMQTQTTFLFTLVVMMGPAMATVSFFQNHKVGMIALQSLDALALNLGGTASRFDEPLEAASTFHDTLVIRGATYTYREDGSPSPFVVGPIDLSIRRGEIVYLIGGNGSGKTTLAKLLTGLYLVDRGSISIDGQEVTPDLLRWYRQHFAAIFSDFHLFTEILDANDGVEQNATRLLHELELDRKVRIEGNQFSTLSLSHGQRKRLALVNARLEDRPIYLFDEWAADQDPTFRSLFYTKLLPELKAAGKTCLVITHDDRYFDLADRVVKMELGRIVSDTEPQRDAASTA